MNIEELRDYCLSKPGVAESFPFDETTLVFKVMGKIFALTDLEAELSVNLKCDPDRAIELREKHAAVSPGYHMNKKHWNTILINGSMAKEEIKHWIDHSYQLVKDSLPKKIQKEIK